jgi:hypothetical protein
MQKARDCGLKMKKPTPLQRSASFIMAWDFSPRLNGFVGF